MTAALFQLVQNARGDAISQTAVHVRDKARSRVGDQRETIRYGDHLGRVLGTTCLQRQEIRQDPQMGGLDTQGEAFPPQPRPTTKRSRPMVQTIQGILRVTTSSQTSEENPPFRSPLGVIKALLGSLHQREKMPSSAFRKKLYASAPGDRQRVKSESL